MSTKVFNKRNRVFREGNRIMSEVNTAGEIYCPYCLSYYKAGEYHTCQSSSNWVQCPKCNIWYDKVIGAHICLNEETLFDRLGETNKLLRELIDLIKEQ